MRTLSDFELKQLFEFFEGEEPGYVLDFSNRTFNEFTEREIGVRVQDLYQGEHLSKHKSLCRFCTTKGNEEKAYKLLTSLMNHFDLNLKSQYEFNEQGERQYLLCKKILRDFSPVDSRSPQLSLDEMTGRLRALYKDGAMFLIAGAEDRITIGLEHLAAFIESAIKCGELRIFGHPLVIRVLTDLAKLGGENVRPTESKRAENAWREFCNKVTALLILSSKRPELSGAAIETRAKLRLCFQSQITERGRERDFYGSISPTVLRSLVDSFRWMAIQSHPRHRDVLELMYCGIFNNEWEVFDFLPVGEEDPKGAFEEDDPADDAKPEREQPVTDERTLRLAAKAEAVNVFNHGMLDILPAAPVTDEAGIRALIARLTAFFEVNGAGAVKTIQELFDAIEQFKDEDRPPDCKAIYRLSYSASKVMARLVAQFPNAPLLAIYEDHEVTFFKALLPPADTEAARRAWKTQLRLLPNKRKSLEVLVQSMIAFLKNPEDKSGQGLPLATHGAVGAKRGEEEGLGIGDSGLGEASDATREIRPVSENSGGSGAESVEEIVAKSLPLLLGNSQKSLDDQVTTGIRQEGITKFPMPDAEKQKELLAFVPKGQHDWAIRFWKRLAERGVERHEFVQPGNPFMNQALYPFSDDFFKLRERAGREANAPKIEEEMRERLAGFLGSWQTFSDRLSEFFGTTPLVIKAQSAIGQILNIYSQWFIYQNDKEELKRRFLRLKDALDDLSIEIATIQSPPEPHGVVRVHPKISYLKGQYVIVGNRKYEFKARIAWIVVLRFLNSIQSGECHDQGRFPVRFTTRDRAVCRGKCGELIRDYIELEPVTWRDGDRERTYMARFMLERLHPGHRESKAPEDKTAAEHLKAGQEEARRRNEASFEKAKADYIDNAILIFDGCGLSHYQGDRILELLDSFKHEPNSTWANAEPFCFDDLECIRVALSAGAAICYDTFAYEEGKGVVPSGTTFRETFESRFVNGIVSSVCCYFQNALSVAEKIGSPTYGAWSDSLSVIVKCCYGKSEDRCSKAEAYAIANCLEENCPKLAAHVSAWLARQAKDGAAKEAPKESPPEASATDLSARAEEYIRHLYEEDEKNEADHLARIAEQFRKNWLLIPDPSKDKDKPKGFAYFDALEKTLKYRIEGIAKGEVAAPMSSAEWQYILPEALTFPDDIMEYRVAADDDDDPSICEEKLPDGVTVRIGNSSREHPLSDSLTRVKNLTLQYLTDAFKFAKKVNSPSKEKWADALGFYYRVNHAFRMPQSRDLLVKMAQAMVEAATRLHVDLMTEDDSPNDTGVTEVISRLDDIKAGQEDIKGAIPKVISRLRTIQKTVDGDHTKITEKSPANEKRVKKAVGLYYKLVKDGMPERNATTEACNKVDDEMGHGDYSSIATFRNAVDREIKDRLRHYGDRAAKVFFEENPE